MQVLGYIVTNRKIKNIDGFVVQVSDISLADSTKPILIVGWELAKKQEGYTSVLDRHIGDNIYWTFSRTESRMDFESDLEKFYNIIYDNKLNKINYYYINIFKLKYNKIKKIYNILFSKDLLNIYISNNMIYIPYNNNVFGISLNVLEYIGIKRNKVINKIRLMPNVRIYEDNDKFIFKILKHLGNKKYAIPYFVSS